MLLTIIAASYVSEWFQIRQLEFLNRNQRDFWVICELKGKKNLSVSGQKVTSVKTYLLVVNDRGYRASQDYF